MSFLSNSTVEVILGSLLGDGSISLSKGYANARFAFRHSQKQLEYFNSKVSLLREISSEKNIWRQVTGTNEYSPIGSIKFRFQSLALPQLTSIYKLVTRRGKKVIRRKWLNLLSPLSLAIWWMDDGSVVSNGRKGVFCTDSFSYKEIEVLQRYLKTVWGIETHLGETSASNSRKRRYFRLYIQSSEELKKFFRIILPHIQVKEMLYKVLVLYKDSKLQERWISEIVKLSKFDRKTVEEIVSVRKSSLKAFDDPRERYSPIPLVTKEVHSNMKMTRVVHAVNYGC